MEVWKPVVGYEGRYEVSSTGRVRGLERHVRTGANGLRKTPGRVLAFDVTNGYARVTLQSCGVSRKYFAHSLVAASFIGPRPYDFQVRHLDGDRGNNNVLNLAYGTAKQNAADKVRHGRAQNGVRHGCARLTEGDIAAIRCADVSALGARARLADRFRCTRANITRIRNGRTWKHLPIDIKTGHNKHAFN